MGSGIRISSLIVGRLHNVAFRIVTRSEVKIYNMLRVSKNGDVSSRRLLYCDAL
jgi:hypothetical protein